jgi:polar amino acid transport system substrate-binding protein
MAICALNALWARPSQAANDTESAFFTLDVRGHVTSPDISNVPRIRFLTTLDFPPFNFLDRDGRLSGFNVDLVRDICEDLKVTAKCQIQALPYDELQKALENRSGDAVIAGISVTSSLRQQFAFTLPYVKLPARFLAGKSVPDGVPSTGTMLKRKIGVVRDTAHQAMFDAFFPAIRPVLFDDRDKMLAALKGGEVDAAFSDGLQLAFWRASEAADGCCKFWGGPYFSQDYLGEGMSIMTRRSEPLSAAFDHALLNLARNGKLNDLFVKYFPAGIY